MVKASEQHLQVPDSIPLKDEFQTWLKKSPRYARSLSGYVLYDTLRLGHCKMSDDDPLVMEGQDSGIEHVSVSS